MKTFQHTMEFGKSWTMMDVISCTCKYWRDRDEQCEPWSMRRPKITTPHTIVTVVILDSGKCQNLYILWTFAKV
jgi:hypothetical protein